MDENRLPELPQEAFRPMIAQSVQLEQFLGEELIFCFRDLDGVHTFLRQAVKGDKLPFFFIQIHFIGWVIPIQAKMLWQEECYLQYPILRDTSQISQIHIAQIIYAVFQRPASTTIHADLFALVSVLNIPDEAQISIRDLFCVLGLHDAVIDPEYPGAKLDFLLRRAEWVDQFTNGLIQLFRRRGAL